MRLTLSAMTFQFNNIHPQCVCVFVSHPSKLQVCDATKPCHTPTNTPTHTNTTGLDIINLIFYNLSIVIGIDIHYSATIICTHVHTQANIPHVTQKKHTPTVNVL